MFNFVYFNDFVCSCSTVYILFKLESSAQCTHTHMHIHTHTCTHTHTNTIHTQCTHAHTHTIHTIHTHYTHDTHVFMCLLAIHRVGGVRLGGYHWMKFYNVLIVKQSSIEQGQPFMYHLYSNIVGGHCMNCFSWPCDSLPRVLMPSKQHHNTLIKFKCHTNHLVWS